MLVRSFVTVGYVPSPWLKALILFAMEEVQLLIQHGDFDIIIMGQLRAIIASWKIELRRTQKGRLLANVSKLTPMSIN